MMLLENWATAGIYCEGAMASADPGHAGIFQSITNPIGEPIGLQATVFLTDPPELGIIECKTRVEVLPDRAFVEAIAGIEAVSGWGYGVAAASTGFSFQPTESLFAARIEGVTDTSLGSISINIQNATSGLTLLDWTGASIDETFIWLLDPADTYTVLMNAESSVSGGNAYVQSYVGLTCEVVPVPGAVLLGVLGLGVAGSRLRRRREI